MPGAGQFNTLITIKKKTDSVNEDTGEVTTTFSDYHRKVPAMREDVSGGSTRRGMQVEESVRSVFTIPWIQDLSTHWRVKVINREGNGPELEIVTILERDDRRRVSELHCAEIK